jgi:hypothetical protein
MKWNECSESNSLPCGPTHNWSPSVLSLWSELWRVLRTVSCQLWNWHCYPLSSCQKHDYIGNPFWIMYGLLPKWSLVIWSEQWFCSKCWPKELWKIASQFQNFHLNFRISHIVLYEIITTQVPKICMGAHKIQRMASAFTFLEQYHKDGDEFLSHIVWATGDETCISFVNVETKDQCIHTRLIYRPEFFKEALSVCQKADGSCFMGQEGSADSGIHATRADNNITSVLWDTKRNCIGPFRTWNADIGIVLLHDNACQHMNTITLSSTAGAFQLTALISLWVTSFFYLPEDLVGITLFPIWQVPQFQ